MKYVGYYLIQDVFNRKLYFFFARDAKMKSFINGWKKRFGDSKKTQICKSIRTDLGTMS